ncbi:MAG: helix-turn-helix domain-containing protein [Candidatus Saccharicenans sp.]
MTITQEELARRLREARERAGFTQAQVAAALNLERPIIAQIEAGRRKVSSLELAALARLYGRSLQSFFEEVSEPDGISYLWRAAPELRQEPKIQKAISRGLEIINSILDLENKIGLSRLSSGPSAAYSKKIGNKWEAIQHGLEVAIQERRRLNLGIAPLFDPAAILDDQGILILGLELPAGISGFSFRSGQAIVCGINAKEPQVRQRYSIVHEYCHVLCDLNDLPAIISCSDKGKDLREVRANVFAANFLMPEEAVKSFLFSRGKGIASRARTQIMLKDEIVPYEARRPEQALKINYLDITLMANHFGVSVESAAWRLQDLGFISKDEQKDLLEKDKSEIGKVLKKYLGQQGVLSKDRGQNKIAYQNAGERLLSLAIEAFRQGLISRNKLVELLKLAGLLEKDIFEIPEARRT